ncbi:thiol:disulfide interchange protein DsbD [Modicisalibacter muralis]|uniref:Thiol:disulfide interchange protein DsbD n=1 Tax=Modicisalibacter muralis TaxID=119000 RepID=A0A1G9IXK7_9GAMM|nr:protein-disulfide reductase DsbD [Halomonas muralis]SDL30009.1 thiol:disulfide interchange protein DsbD [Halomonas muralis]
MSDRFLMRAWRQWTLLAIAALLAVLSLPASATEDFLPVDQAFQLEAEQQGDEIVLRWEIAPGYYLYRHRLGVEGMPSAITPPAMPNGETISDEYFGESVVYYDVLEVRVDPGQAERLALTWQGCAEAGLCYAPQHDTLDLTNLTLENGTLADNGGFFSQSSPGLFANASPSASSERTNVTSSEALTATGVTEASLGEDQRLAARLANAHIGWTLAAFFGMGLLLVFTPCVLPMVPILSSLVVGAGASARRGLLLSIAFVMPMALTYAALGVVAALAGASLQAMLQTPWVLGGFAALFVVLALAMFGLFELELPQALRQRFASLQQRQRGGTLGGGAAMGVLSALLVGPCMTAPLAGALLYIADSGNALLGGSALLALGLGMGAPLLLVGTLGARLLPRPGPWMTRIKALFGFVLLGMAIWFVARVIPASVELGLWGVWLIGAAVALWQMSVSHSPTARQLIARTSGLVLGLWGATLIVGSAGGGESFYRPLATIQSNASTERLQEAFMARFAAVEGSADLKRRIEQAGNRGQWTLVDVYADWCVSCQVIEDEVFGDARVQAKLAGMQLLRPDVTDNNAADRELLEAYGILGPPTLMLFDPDGRERRAQRIVGEIDAEAFLKRLERARQATGDAS